MAVIANRMGGVKGMLGTILNQVRKLSFPLIPNLHFFTVAFNFYMILEWKSGYEKRCNAKQK